MNARLLVAGAALALVGCDPGWQIAAVVRSAPPCDGTGRAADATAPLAGARVVYKCDGERDRDIGTTDRAGRVHFGSLGFLSDRCLIVVSRDGYEPQVYRVHDVCALESSGFWGAGSCFEAYVPAELVPARSAAPPKAPLP